MCQRLHLAAGKVPADAKRKETTELATGYTMSLPGQQALGSASMSVRSTSEQNKNTYISLFFILLISLKKNVFEEIGLLPSCNGNSNLKKGQVSHTGHIKLKMFK